jgi:hypothetical protein
MDKSTTLTLALAVSLTVIPQASPTQTAPQLRGTFLQPRLDQRWTYPKLRDLLLAVRRLGLSEIVVQWTVVGTSAFYRSDAFQRIEDPPLESLLKLADEFDLKVRVGLAHDVEFWDRIKLKSSVRDVEEYLQFLRRRSTTAARELSPVVGQHRSFDGWFITEEIDDVNWLPPERRALLRSYLTDLRRTLRMLRSSASVAVSGFSNAHCDPATLETFWRELLSATDVDQVLFQDGVGAHKLALPYLPLYLGAMKRAAVDSGHALSVVVELFDQVEGSPVTEGSFKAVPAGIDRLARQLDLAREASTAGVLAFSVPDYMVPGAGPRAEQLFSAYVKRYCGDGNGGTTATTESSGC